MSSTRQKLSYYYIHILSGRVHFIIFVHSGLQVIEHNMLYYMGKIGVLLFNWYDVLWNYSMFSV